VKKICHISLLAILMIMPLSLTCMHSNNLLNISSVKNIIKEKYSNNTNKRKLFIKRFLLINDALHTRPDQFKDFYSTLQPTDRTHLVKTSGEFNSHGKKNAWHFPQITLALIDVYFECNNDLRDYIKSYYKEEEDKDKHLIHNYFKSKLINNKKSSVVCKGWYEHNLYAMRKEIYLGSFFINGGNTIKQDEHPVNLNINNKSYRTYAIHFGSDNYEYRITGINKKQCLLWIINQKNQNAICSNPIKFKDPIKGYRLSATNNAVEYAVIYSDREMICATIDRENKPFKIVSASTSENKIIIDACYNPLNNNWAVGFLDYIQLKYNINWLSNDGICSDAITSFFINDHGLLKNISISKTPSGYCMIILCGLANQCKIHSYISDENGNWLHSFSTKLKSIDQYNYIHDIDIIDIKGKIEAFDLKAPFFVNTNQKNESWIHNAYSPDGAFLMCNFLKRKMGMSYVETVLKDPITHETLASFDMKSGDFIGAGFTPDGKNLVLTAMNSFYKYNLWNDEDTKMLNAIEKKAFSCSGVLSLLSSLCTECKEKEYVLVKRNDTIYNMLVDWSKESKIMLDVLEQCLPVFTQENIFMKKSIYEKKL